MYNFLNKKYLCIHWQGSIKEPIFDFVVFSNKQQKIDSLQVAKNIEGIDSLKDAISGMNVPIIIIFNGNECFEKTVKGNLNAPDLLLTSALPGAKVSDFVFNATELKAGSSHISILRKSHFSEIIDTLEKNDIKLIDFSFGQVVSNVLSDYLAKGTFIFNGYEMYFENKQLLSIRKTALADSKYFDLEKESLEAFYFFPYAGILNYISAPQFANFGNDNIQSSYVEKNKIRLERYLKLPPILIVCLFTIGILNAVNYFLDKKYDELFLKHGYSNEKIASLESDKTDFIEFMDYANSVQIIGSAKTSFYADRIAASLPINIKLLSLIINPLVGREDDYSNTEIKVYEKEKILITGLIKGDLFVLNSWLKKLENIEWIDHIQHQTIKHTDKKSINFQIEVVTDNRS